MFDPFAKARRTAYTRLEIQMATLGLDIEAGIIGLRALRAWRETWLPLYDYSREYGDWPWESLVQEFDQPGRFDLAIWSGDDLCALAIGDGVSAGRQHVRWNFVEGWRLPNALSDLVLDAADFCVSAYALELGVRIVHVDCPAPDLQEDWERLGYGEVERPSGYLRPIRQKAIYTV